jgi:hypothetical protein
MSVSIYKHPRHYASSFVRDYQLLDPELIYTEHDGVLSPIDINSQGIRFESGQCYRLY